MKLDISIIIILTSIIQSIFGTRVLLFRTPLLLVGYNFYVKINEKKYTNLFTAFIFCIGLFLLLKDLIK
ncbi:hypothetical protein OAD01_01050 [Candidatus Marinimicrobia bacterium]|nr:hypothetical protein [Candidatus Neomarinimicrobiota bacterium]